MHFKLVNIRGIHLSIWNVNRPERTALNFFHFYHSVPEQQNWDFKDEKLNWILHDRSIWTHTLQSYHECYCHNHHSTKKTRTCCFFHFPPVFFIFFFWGGGIWLLVYFLFFCSCLFVVSVSCISYYQLLFVFLMIFLWDIPFLWYFFKIKHKNMNKVYLIYVCLLFHWIQIVLFQLYLQKFCRWHITFCWWASSMYCKGFE